MKKYKTTLKRVTLVVAVAVVSLTVGAFLGKRNATPKITSDLIEQQIKNSSELTTLEYLYTNIGEFENNLDFNGWNIPLTTKEFVLSYDGVIKAGVDLEQLSVSVNKDVITITLPEAYITAHEIDEESVQLFNETTNIFNPIRVEDYIDFTTVLKEEKEADLETKGFLVEARERSKEVLTSLINTMTDHTYTIEFTE